MLHKTRSDHRNPAFGYPISAGEQYLQGTCLQLKLLTWNLITRIVGGMRHVGKPAA